MNTFAGTQYDLPQRSSRQRNQAQRWGALIGGGALAVYGLTRRSTLGTALAAGGGALAYYGAKANVAQRESLARSSMLLNCSPEEAYRFWRNFENLPLFMFHLESVTIQNPRQSKWVAMGPLGKRVSWSAEIVEERENELISWRSLPGSEVDVMGRVEFRPAHGNRGTLLSVAFIYRPPAGEIGRIVAKILGKDPSFMVRQDLRRMKALIETGEIPTTEGQPHGRRDVMTAVARVVDPDRPIRPEAEFKEVLSAKRRVS